MSVKKVESKKPAVTIIPRISKTKKNLEKFMEPQQDVREALSTTELQIRLHDLVKKATSLSVLAGRHLAKVDWLQEWNSFEFDAALTKAQIVEKQQMIEMYVRGYLSNQNSITGDAFLVVEFDWQQGNNDHEFTLSAYLNPPASVKVSTALLINTGAAPLTSGSVSPMPPTQPPPPSLS
jgi:hypothetical protein